MKPKRVLSGYPQYLYEEGLRRRKARLVDSLVKIKSSEEGIFLLEKMEKCANYT
jgi:hypothetical protein